VTDLAALVVRMQADNSQYVKALDQATTKLQKFSADQGKIFDDIASKIGAAFTIGALVDFSASVLESASSLERLSQSAGISVESLSSLRLAAAAGGLSQDELGQSLKKLNVNLSDAAGNATGKAGVAFRALGISVTNANGSLKDAGTVLAEIADKFQGFADGPNKTAIAVELLGRQGQNLIPILNQGSAGLDDFKKQAQDAGIVLSGPLAAAAEEFSQKFAVIKATLSSGFGNQLAAQLLPVLSTLAEQFTSSTSAGEAFGVVANVIVGGVKLVAATVIEVVAEFTKLGDSIGALGAIAVAVAHGNFSEASDIWKQSNADNVATTQAAQNKIRDIMVAGTDQQLSIVQTTAQKIKDSAPNVAALQQSDEAIKKLQEFNDNLKAESAAFGLGGAALVNYKLQYGPLADAIKKAGDEGQKLAASIRANAAALQGKQDTKEITDYTDKLQEQVNRYGESSIAAIDYATNTGKLGAALDRMGSAGDAARAHIHDLAVEQIQLKNTDAFHGIDDQLLTLTGHLAQAAQAAFEFNNRLLIKDVAATGTDEQKAKLDQLKQATVAQAAFNEEAEKANVIQTQLATAEANIAAAQSAGQITELQAQAQLQDARATAITQLNQIAAAEQNIATSSGLPKLTLQTQQFQNSITALASQQDVLTKQIRGDLEDSLVQPLTDAETGAKSVKEAFSDMIKSIEKDLLTIANKNIAESIFGTGGAAGGAAGGLASLFGGSGSGGGSGGFGLGGLASLFGKAAGGGSSGSGLLGGITSLFGKSGGASAASGAPTAADISSSTAGIGDIDVGALEGFATGGTLSKGQLGIVGEKGPELAYAGAKDMNIIPNGVMGGGHNITNHFVISSQNGQISRQSQMQVAAAAARSLGAASARNNR
jgi:hypothetical protein